MRKMEEEMFKRKILLWQIFKTDTFDILEHGIPRDESIEQILGATNNGPQASSSAGPEFIATMFLINSMEYECRV